jgi:hypothetical protein
MSTSDTKITAVDEGEEAGRFNESGEEPPMGIIPKATFICTFTLPLTGCVLDLNKLAKDNAKPSVSFEAPTAWTCTKTAKLPTNQGIEACSVCRNTPKAVHAVTLNKQRQGVNPGQSVYLCPLMVVEGQAVQP